MLSSFVSSFISKSAEESEIAEVKAVISGVKIPFFFSPKTFCFKYLSVSLAIGGGLSIGKEGAFVHLSSIISNKILKLRIFKFIYKNSTLRNQFLLASVAAGFTAVFRNSIGAMLFSIEVASSCYIVSNMWKAAFCTLCCSIAYQLLLLSDLIDSIEYSHFPILEVDVQLIFFAILGTISGLLGVLLIISSRYLISLRKMQRLPFIHMKYRYMLLVSIMTSIITFTVPVLRETDFQVINNMFKNDLNETKWNDKSVGMNLAIFFIIKYLLTALSTSLELPTGIIFPLLACGSVWGRLFGLFSELVTGKDYSGIYAAVGSATLVASTTHSVSISIVVFAISGQIHYLVPMIISVFFACGISSYFTISYYDSMLELNEIAYFPLLQPLKSYNLAAKDILSVDFPCLSSESTLRDLIDAIFQASKYIKRIPIIKKNGILLYDITIDNAKKYIYAYYYYNRSSFPKESLKNLDNIVEYIAGYNNESFIEVENESYAHSEITTQSDDMKYFAKVKIDVNSELLRINDSPFSVMYTTVYAKVQFLFLSLNLTQIYVTRKGELLGIITRDSFALAYKKSFAGSEHMFQSYDYRSKDVDSY